MNRLIQSHLLACLMIVKFFSLTHELVAADKVSGVDELQPPIARKVLTKTELFGDEHQDEYHWLCQRDNPEVLAYLQAWNAYSIVKMKSTEALQKQLYRELEKIIDWEGNSAPYRVGNYFYYERQKKKQNFPLFCRRLIQNKIEEILLDQNLLAENKPYFKLINAVPSPDGKYLAFAIDELGTQYAVMYFKNCETGKWLIENIPHVTGEIVWSSDSQGIWYVAVDNSFRENRVLYHRLKTDPLEDRVILEEPDSLYTLGIVPSADGRFVFLYDKSINTSQVYYVKIDCPERKPVLIFPKTKGVFYKVEAYQDRFYLIAREDQVDQLYVSDICNPREWSSLDLHHQAQAIHQIIPFKNFLVIEILSQGLKKIEIWDFVHATIDYLEFPDIAYALQIPPIQDYDSNLFIFTYASPIQPPITYAYHLQTKEKKVLRKFHFKGFRPHQYHVERIHVKAPDGTFVPLSLFHKKEARQAGTAPVLLLGYGAYGIPYECGFFSHLLPLINRGFILAIAHVRGGGEYGPPWYNQGRWQQKKNTFHDFIACAEYLIHHGYTTPQQLVIEGRSAGGLLMGVVANWRPELFKAVVAEVPFVDAINTLLDASIPLTIQEEEEWGTPLKQEDYAYIKSYSPYDNVRRMNYPSFLITGGFYDAQVAYWEPAKWAAKLLDHKTNDALLLFKVNLTGGHLRSSRRTENWKELAFKYAFILSQVGISH